MYVPLGHHDTGMSRQLHDCKCIRSGLPQARQEGVPESVEDELPWEYSLFLTVYNWLASPMVQMI